MINENLTVDDLNGLMVGLTACLIPSKTVTLSGMSFMVRMTLIRILI